MESEQKQEIPTAQILYGDIVYWVTIGAAVICMVGPVIALIAPENNLLNPHYLFAAIFAGKDAPTIWNEVGQGFPGGHFWYGHLTYGDGLTQFGLALGCSVALWALLAAALSYTRQRVRLYALLALWVALLVFLSAAGIIKEGH